MAKLITPRRPDMVVTKDGTFTLPFMKFIEELADQLGSASELDETTDSALALEGRIQLGIAISDDQQGDLDDDEALIGSLIARVGQLEGLVSEMADLIANERASRSGAVAQLTAQLYSLDRNSVRTEHYINPSWMAG